MAAGNRCRGTELGVAARRQATSISIDRWESRTFLAEMGSMCDTCHAGCCRAYNLLITVYDALIISRDLSLPISEFVTMLPKDEKTKEKMGDLHTPIRFSDPGFEDSYFYLMLKRVDSKLVPGTAKCYFLHEWTRAEAIASRGNHLGATIAGRCGIYASRPLMCRAYPAFLHQNGALGFLTNPKPLPQAKMTAAYELCPEKWSTPSFTGDPNQTLHNLVLNRYEIDFQNQLIKEWNTTPRTLKEFLPYAVACYANRFRLAPELIEKAPETAPAATGDVTPMPQ